MGNLRELVESDLETTLEDSVAGFGLPIELIDPDGNEETVNGQVLYDTIIENPETGQEIVVPKPVVSIRRSSLSRIPKDGESWLVRIPETPAVEANKEDYLLERPSEGGRTIGYIRLYLMKAKQST